MKIRTFIISMTLIFAAELTALLIFAAQDTEHPQNAAAVNEALHSVLADWETMENHRNRTNLDYVVLDAEEHIVFKTRSGLSESIRRNEYNGQCAFRRSACKQG